MRRQSKAQKETVGRVMHEYKHGELGTRGGRKVRNPKQAIAIALREAGASKDVSPKENRRNLSRTKARERKAATGADRRRKGSRGARSGNAGASRRELYAEARRRNIPGRSHMNKTALERALRGAA